MKTLRICFVLMLGLAFGFMTSPGAANAALTVSLPADQPCVVGNTVDFSINISGFTTETVGGYAIRLSYDTSILTNPSIIETGTLSAGKGVISGVPGDGIGNYSIGVPLGLGATSDGILIKVRFTVANSFPGTKNITFAQPGVKTVLSDPSFLPITATWNDGSYFITGLPTGTIALTPNPASIVADGASTSTITSAAIKDFQGVNVPDGTKITVATTAGTITTADADGGLAGIQVLTSGGAIAFLLQSATTIGTANVTAESAFGDATGATAVNFIAGPVSAGDSSVEVDKTSTGVGTEAGDGITVTVTLKDANDNVIQGTQVFLSVTGSGNYINATAGNGPTSIGATDGSGVATGVIRSTKAEGKTISARGGATVITSSTPSVTYTPGSAEALSVAGVADPVTAGSATDVVVTALDEFGNVATGYTGTVAFTSSDGEAVLPGDYTFVGGDNGTKTFADAVVLKTAGEQTMTATDTVTASITGSQSGITVNPAAANTLVVSGITDPVTAGVASNVTVTARDEFDNVATGYVGTIAFTSTDGQAVLPANYTFAAGDNGTKTFTGGVTLKTAGERTVTATDTVTASITGAQTDITVTPAAAVALAVTGISDPVTAGVASDVVVTARDDFNNVATGYVGTIAFTSTDAQAVLPGNYTFVAGDSGTKTFTSGVTLKTVGEQSVTATDTVTGSITGAQSEITVNAAAAAKVGLTASKTTLASDQKGSATLTATLLDNFNNTVTTDGITINLVIDPSDPDTDIYVVLDNAAPTTIAGVATSTITTKAGPVTNPPNYDKVTAQSGGLTDSDPIQFMLVNFSIQVNTPAAPFLDGTGVHLVRSGSTPTTATFEGVGSTSGDYRWALTGVGSISSTTADAITYTAPATITGDSQTGTLTLTSASDGALTDTITITVYNPVAVTWPTAAAGIATGDTSKKVTASGGTGTYAFQGSNDAVATVGLDGTITPVAAGTLTVKVRDATYGSFSGDPNGFVAESVQIEIVEPIVVTPATVNLLASETEQFAAEGGKGGGEAANYTWSVDNAAAGSINAGGLFTAAAVTAAQTATITATDKTYTNIKGTATVFVYPTLTIKLPDGYDPENPATWPLVLSGGTYAFEVIGGEGSSYTWSVEGPVEVAGGAGEAFNFVAPTEGPFAGVYTVTVTDVETGKTFSMNVKVPMTFTPANLSMLGDSTLSYEFMVAGAPQDSDFAVTLVTTSKADIATPEEYGTVDADAAFDALSTAGLAFTPADITGAYKSFLFKAQAVEDDGTPLKDAGLDIVYSGVMRIFPVAEFNGVVVDANGDPIADVQLVVNLGSEQVEETATDEFGEFSFRVADPASIAQNYLVGFRADGYIPQVVTTQNWVNPRTIVLLTADDVLSIGGTVSDTGANPIAGAKVEATVGGQPLVTYTDAGGNYILNLSLAGTWDYAISENYVDPNEAGCLRNEDETGTVTITETETGLVMVDSEGNTFTGSFNGGEYVFTGTQSEQGGTVTITITVTLDSPISGSGTVRWSWQDDLCTGGGNLTITKQGGELTELIAAASKLGYISAQQDILTNPDFVLELQSGDPEQEVCEAGGILEWPSAIVDIPAGALDGCHMIEVIDNIPVGTETLYTEHSVVLVEINIPPAALPLAKPFVVTIPYDTNEVEPGDFAAGRAVIYHAPTADDLRNGTNLKKVPTSDIISQDPFNGLVTFRVSDLSVFGVGGAQAVPDDGVVTVSGGGDGGCFIDTLTGPSAPGWFAPLILMVLAAGAWIVKRAAE